MDLEPSPQPPRQNRNKDYEHSVSEKAFPRLRGLLQGVHCPQENGLSVVMETGLGLGSPQDAAPDGKVLGGHFHRTHAFLSGTLESPFGKAVRVYLENIQQTGEPHIFSGSRTLTTSTPQELGGGRNAAPDLERSTFSTKEQEFRAYSLRRLR